MERSRPKAILEHTLPVIDISPWAKPGASRRNGGCEATSAALHAACLTYGFFYLDISSIIGADEGEELIQLAREFFAFPQEEKDKMAMKNEDNARGYARLKENVTNGKADNHEGLDFYAPVAEPDRTKPLWGQNQWPSVNGFKEKFDKWIEKMMSLGMMVMEAMAVGLGMTPDEWKELRNQVDNSFWCLRVIGYPPLTNDYDGFSCGAHKDYGCLTFLYADATQDALQVFVPNSCDILQSSIVLAGLPAEEGAEKGIWINANPIPGCMVCNIGAMWETWTNGLYKSTLHRVVHRGATYRVSIPFFYEPNFDAHISPLTAVLRLQDTATADTHLPEGAEERNKYMSSKGYDPVVYGDFLMKKVVNNFSTGAGGGKY